MTDDVKSGGRAGKFGGGRDPSDPRHRRAAQFARTTRDLAGPLRLDQQGRQTLSLSPKSGLFINEQGELDFDPSAVGLTGGSTGPRTFNTTVVGGGGGGGAGPAGPAGADGVDGAPGADGDMGPPGFGEDGAPGEMGPPGSPGPVGATGVTGATGPIGPPGLDGDEVEGPMGPPGSRGEAGPTGVQGATGSAGPPGFGEDGAPGEDGMPGQMGPRGFMGLSGPPGMEGESIEGEMGWPGLAGRPGKDGAVTIIYFNEQGEVESFPERPPGAHVFELAVNSTFGIRSLSLQDSFPIPPTNGLNVKWQTSNLTVATRYITSISAYIPLASVPGRWIKRTIYSAAGSGTHTPDSLCTQMDVLAIGAGGGGGGAGHGAAQSAAGGGGASGSPCFKRFTGVTGTYAYTVGAGGPGGAAGPNAGTAGTDTTFDTMTAQGGNGGGAGALLAAPGSVLGGVAVLSTGGDWNGKGQAGFFGLVVAVAGPVLGGQGGSNLMGGGGAARNTQSNGLNGEGPGAGGGAGLTINGGGPGTTKTGGDGVDGIIIVDEYN